MYPLIKTNDLIRIIKKDTYIIGDIVLYEKKDRLILHRIIYKTKEGGYILVGDNSQGYEDWVTDAEILGAVDRIINKNKKETEISSFHFYNYAVVKYAHIFKCIRYSNLSG